MDSSENNIHNLKDKGQNFKDSESLITLFFDTIEKKRKDNFALLSYYGPKGIGKTSLCKKLCSKLEFEKNILWSFVDFSVPHNRELDGFLVSLRNSFNNKYNITFPSFDIACAYYFQKLHPNSTLKENCSVLPGTKSPLSYILGTLDDLQNKGFIPTLNRIFATPGNLYDIWWKHKGIKELANIPLLDQKDLIVKLSLLWINDFYDFIKNSKKKTIIFLDSYDSLEKELKSGDSFLNTELLQNWILQLVNVLFVTFSEKELSLSGDNKKWNGMIKSVHMKRLPDSDTENYLKKHGIDNEDIINIIKKESNGLPYIVHLALDIFNEIKFKEKREPRIDDFLNINTHSIYKLLTVLSSFEVETLKILSLSSGWDKQLLLSLIAKFKTGYTEIELKDLSRFSFIKETEIPGFCVMDEWFAEVLKSNTDIQKQKEVYKYLFEFYNSSIKSIDIKNISDYDRKSFLNVFQYAKNSLEIKEFTNWFLDFCNRFRKEGQYRFILPFLDKFMKMLNETEKSKSKEFADILNNIGIYYKDLGKYKEAESVFKQSIEILVKITGEESKEVAECIVNLADVIFCQGNFSEAEPLYIKSIMLLNPLSKEESNFSTHSLINVAILFARQGKYEEAISLFEKTLSIKLKTLGEGHPDVSNIYTNIANIEFDRKNFEKAEILYRKILDWEIKYYGENHPEIRKAMINLGNILIEEKKYEESTMLYEKAKGIIEEYFGSEHPDYAMALNNLAYVNYITKNYDKSEIYYLESLNIYKNILGIDHPEIATLYTNLGNLYTNMKKFNDAEKYLKNSLKIKSDKFGHENPETAITYKGFAELYETVGNKKLTLFYLKKYEKILLKQAQSDNQELKQIRETISALSNK